jgi:hypothetical protein
MRHGRVWTPLKALKRLEEEHVHEYLYKIPCSGQVKQSKGRHESSERLRRTEDMAIGDRKRLSFKRGGNPDVGKRDHQLSIV